MSLYDHYSDGQYLSEGWHDVRVESCKTVVGTSRGTEGIEFSVVDPEIGRGCRATFWLTEKAIWRLAQFAHACGLTEDEMKRYDEKNLASHRTLINRRVKVLVEKVDKYHEVTDWSPVNEPEPRAPMRPPAPTEPQAPDPASIPF
jgi:hypothetical protein